MGREMEMGELKVLVVEDEAAWQSLIGRAIQKIQPRTQVIYSSSAGLAMSLVRENQDLDFIICDQSLEGAGTGLDLWDQLLEEKAGIPFVLMTGTRKQDFVVRISPFREQEIPQYVEKPGTSTELLQVMRTLLQSISTQELGSDSQVSSRAFWFFLFMVTAFSLSEVSLLREADPFLTSVGQKKPVLSAKFLEKVQALADSRELLTEASKVITNHVGDHSYEK